MSHPAEAKNSSHIGRTTLKRDFLIESLKIVVDTLAWPGVALSSEFTPSILEGADELVKTGAPFSVIRRELERMHADDLIAGRSDIEREWAELSGVDVLHMTASFPLASFEDTLKNIAIWQRKFDSLEYLVKPTRLKDIEQAKAQAKRAIIMGF